MTDMFEQWKQRERERTKTELDNPYSDRSGYGDGELFGALLDKFQHNPDSSSATRLELEMRVRLHTAVKALQLQARIAADQAAVQQTIAHSAEQTAARLTRATWVLAISTGALVAATIVLVIVTAVRGGG